MAALGGIALVAQLVQFFWLRGDRADKQLADMIRAGDKTRAAIGDVALIHIENAEVFTTANDHQHLAREVGEVKAIVRNADTKLNQLLVIAASRRLQFRKTDNEEEDPFS